MFTEIVTVLAATVVFFSVSMLAGIFIDMLTRDPVEEAKREKAERQCLGLMGASATYTSEMYKPYPSKPCRGELRRQAALLSEKREAQKEKVEGAAPPFGWTL
ncbi:MAG: hypothetical protein EB060_08850 [Proteobacteria bacterium]|nr:hypothetical protein [Pseudomonadota bacterium]